MASKTQKAKETIRDFCQTSFGTPDRFGNFKFSSHGVEYRIKMQKTSWRFERRATSVSPPLWIRVRSHYYTDKAGLSTLEYLAKRVL